MLTEIISTVVKALDAQKPTETHLVLFKEMKSYYDPDTQSETFNLHSYKVIVDDPDPEVAEYEFLKLHTRTLDKATLDAMRAAMTITSTDYTDIRNEEIIKGVQMLVDSEGIFGLTGAQLTLR